MSSVSPVESQRSGPVHRGGRPKQWVPLYVRKLARLYLYTRLPVETICELLQDKFWHPGKEAATKVLHRTLGKEYRWLRPRDIDEQRERISSLKESDRARKPSAHQPTHGNETTTEFAPHVVGSGLVDATFGEPDYGLAHTGTTVTVAALSDANLKALESSRAPTGFLPRVLSRQGTGFSMSSINSFVDGFSAVRQKLTKRDSGYSRSDAQDVFRLLTRFTINGNSDSLQHMISTSSPIVEESESFEKATLETPMAGNIGWNEHRLLPDALIDAGWWYSELQMKLNVALLDIQNLGEILDGDSPIFAELDRFNHTMYHFLAATDGLQHALLQVVHRLDEYHIDVLNATNTGGQTLLHALHSSWFDDGSFLESLLDDLRRLNLNFYGCDLYGRNFFHILEEKMSHNMDRAREITYRFELDKVKRRDAFGAEPTARSQQATTPLTHEEPRMPLRITPVEGGTSAKLEYHARLLVTINAAHYPTKNPTYEDAQGQNALHCLGKVILGSETVQEWAGEERAKKRRRTSQKNEDSSQSSEISTNVPAAVPLKKRSSYLELLLSAGVDVNHYDLRGNMPLMSFIAHIEDGQEDEDLRQMLLKLIRAGARLEARNRAGETALHIAARTGQKSVLRFLVERGANVDARNGEGLGVLQVLDREVAREAEDKANARLEACRATLTGTRYRKARPKQFPNALDEWTAKREYEREVGFA